MTEKNYKKLTKQELIEEIKKRDRKAIKIEQMLAENVEKTNEFLFEELFTMNPIPSTITQLSSGKIEKANDAFCELVGYKTKELIGRKMSELQLWADEGIRDRITEILKVCGFVHNENIKVRNKSGEIKDTIFSSKILKNSNPTKIVSVAVDVSIQKRVEKELEESEKNHRTIFESSTDGILVVAVEGNKIVYTNNAFREMLGYSKEEILRKKILDILPKDHSPNINSDFEAIKEQNSELFENISFLRKDSKIVLTDINTSLINFDGVKCFMGSVRDVTERVALEAKTKFISSITSNVSDAIMALDLDFRITYANKSAEELYQCKAEDLFMKSIDVLVAEKGYPLSLDSFPNIALSKNVNGGTFYCETVMTPLFDEDNKLFAYTVIQRDVSEEMDEKIILKDRLFHYKVAADESFEALVVHNKNIIMFANKQFYDLFGGKQNEVINKNILSFISPSNHEALLVDNNDVDKAHEYKITVLRKNRTGISVEMKRKKTNYNGREVNLLSFRECSKSPKDGREIGAEE